MALKRMFSLSINNSDAFLNLSVSAQSLYFHLGMRADDRGYIFNVSAITRMTKTNMNDLKELVDNKFVLERPKGLILIKAWKINNTLMHPLETNFIEDFRKIHTERNGMYTEKEPMGESVEKRDNRDMSIEREVEIEKSLDRKEQNKEIIISNKENKVETDNMSSDNTVDIDWDKI